MTLTTDMIQHAKEVRQRLRYPANAVKDIGIDLRRHLIPPVSEKPPTEEPNTITAKVTVQEFRPIKPELEIPCHVILSDILNVVCRYYGVSAEDITGRSRKKGVSTARHAAMYLAWRHNDGGYYGRRKMLYRKFKRDRTTVYAAHWKVQEIMIANGPMAADIALLESLLMVPHAINNSNPAVAAVDQCDLAQEQEVGLPQPEIRCLDQGSIVDCEAGETQKNMGRIHCDDRPESTQQETDRHRQPGESPARPGAEDGAD